MVTVKDEDGNYGEIICICRSVRCPLCSLYFHSWLELPDSASRLLRESGFHGLVAGGALPLAAHWAGQYVYPLVLGLSKFTTDTDTLTVSSPFTLASQNFNMY